MVVLFCDAIFIKGIITSTSGGFLFQLLVEFTLWLLVLDRLEMTVACC